MAPRLSESAPNLATARCEINGDDRCLVPRWSGRTRPPRGEAKHDVHPLNPGDSAPQFLLPTAASPKTSGTWRSGCRPWTCSMRPAPGDSRCRWPTRTPDTVTPPRSATACSSAVCITWWGAPPAVGPGRRRGAGGRAVLRDGTLAGGEVSRQAAAGTGTGHRGGTEGCPAGAVA
jgi:hypothetical protein